MSESKSYGPLIESRCPQCDYTLTGAAIAHGEDAKPEPGDSSICFNCGQILVYRPDLVLRRATALEIRELMNDLEAWKTIEKAQEFIRRRGKIA